MRSAVLLLLAAASPLAAPIMARAAEVQIASEGPVVEIGINKSVMAKPDVGTIGTGVTTREQTAKGALQTNARKMNALIERIRAAGIKREDIQTANFSLSAQYSYGRTGEERRFLGYDASNQVTVTVRDIDRMGTVIDAMANAGATDFNGPSFSLADDTKQRREARGLAFDEAKTLAMDYARLAGYSGVKLLEISENIQTQVYGGGPPNAIVVTGSRKEVSPVEPGQVATMATILAKYEMTR
jgi:uncharacterized protein